MNWKNRDQVITVAAIAVLAFAAFYMIRKDNQKIVNQTQPTS